MRGLKETFFKKHFNSYLKIQAVSSNVAPSKFLQLNQNFISLLRSTLNGPSNIFWRFSVLFAFSFCFLFTLLTSPFSSRGFFFPAYLSFFLHFASSISSPIFLHSPLFSSFLTLMYFIHLPFCPPFVQCKKVHALFHVVILCLSALPCAHFLKQSWRGISLDGRNRGLFYKNMCC